MSARFRSCCPEKSRVCAQPRVFFAQAELCSFAEGHPVSGQPAYGCWPKPCDALGGRRRLAHEVLRCEDLGAKKRIIRALARQHGGTDAHGSAVTTVAKATNQVNMCVSKGPTRVRVYIYIYICINTKYINTQNINYGVLI